MAASTTAIACDIDFDRPGRQVSHLRLDHSDNEHAFGIIPIPIAVIANGTGPTVLLSAGNHGDEYEGQVILRRLIRETRPESVNGRLIILPALNAPAVMAGTRVSPLDGLNLNRCFPGLENGAPTQAIAHFMDSNLLPLCDAGIDLHSGGTIGEVLPCTFLCSHPDRALMVRMLDMVEAFGAPDVYVVEGAAWATGFDTVAQRHGVAFISTELAGGASLDREALQMGREGVLGVLRHLGMLAEDDGGPVQPVPVRFLRAGDHYDSVMVPISGVFEPYWDLGAQVREGDRAGAVHSLEEPERAPVELYFARSGIVVVRRVPARVKPGDYVFHVARQVTRDEILAEIKSSQAKP